MKTKKTEKKIGLFDSGVGGLSILRALAATCASLESEVRFIYLGDTARCPYGDKSSEEITSYVRQITKWLGVAKAERVVMACNTSAAVSGAAARKSTTLPVHDLISATASYAAANYKKIGVIATSTTCKSRAFSQAINKLKAEAEVLEISCPDLVPLIEAGHLSGAEVEQAVDKYARSLNAAGVEALIFGCTHFPFLENVFRSSMNKNVAFIDPAQHLSQEIFGKTNDSPTDNSHLLSIYEQSLFYCTGNPESFALAAERCLNLPSGFLKNTVQHVSLTELQTAENALQSSTGTLNILV
ncbi:MAG: glutamate racemase [Candidatus Obscuribacterales bacterium]|nr:glutamate racemase [Candidatus Obscuribacterales bacterium]